jgi:hypothetical protein
MLLNMLGPDTLSSGEYYDEIKGINHTDLPPDRRKVSTYITTQILAAKPNTCQSKMRSNATPNSHSLNRQSRST